MNRDELLLAQLEDKIYQANERDTILSGDFLDIHQRKIAEGFCKSRKLPVKVFFYGGYLDAERCMPLFIPGYSDLNYYGNEGDNCQLPEELTELLRIIRVCTSKGSSSLTHRDYLGSLLALGINREVTGDILVRSGEGADIIVKSEIADFIKFNYMKAGNANLKVEVLPVSMLNIGEIHITQKHDTVASLRLDNVVASAFGLSRGKASEAIKRGIVSVNSIEAIKVDTEMHKGDKVVVRGRGKVILAEIGGTSRKDRTIVTFNIFN